MKPAIGERGRKSQMPRQEEKKKKNKDESKQTTHSRSQHACVIASCIMKSIYIYIYREREREREREIN